MVLYFLRGAFIVLSIAVFILLYVLPFQEAQEQAFGVEKFLLVFGVTVAAVLGIVAADIFVRQKRLSALAGIFVGLIAGLIAAFALSLVVDLVGVLLPPPENVSPEQYANLLKGIKVLIGLTTCYLGISLVIQTKDDFRFVIPYVEFAKEIRGHRPTLLDTSVIIDGRIVDIVDTLIMQGSLVVPRFILNELQTIADSPDKLRRARGRRGLDVLNKLQQDPAIEVHIDDREAEGGTVDQKLVTLAQAMRARIMTNDFNLAKVAKLRGVDVINLNDLAKALRPVVLPGETMSVRIIKAGESPGQGVGYLEDGTMVVVENARQHISQEVPLVVTSSIQTSAGRMIFGRYADDEAGDVVTPSATSSISDDSPTVESRTSPHRHTTGRNPRRSH